MVPVVFLKGVIILFWKEASTIDFLFGEPVKDALHAKQHPYLKNKADVFQKVEQESKLGLLIMKLY